MKTYKAPWSTSLIVVSVLATLLCLGITFGIPLLPAPKHCGELAMWLRWLPMVLIIGSALFTIRGYTISPDAILVHRLLWATRLPRAGVQSAEFVPNAMRKSLRSPVMLTLYAASSPSLQQTLHEGPPHHRPL